MVEWRVTAGDVALAEIEKVLGIVAALLRIRGNRLQLAFAMKGGRNAKQWLYFERGGGVAHKVMIVSNLGVPVARLDETITRKGSQAGAGSDRSPFSRAEKAHSK